MIRILLVDDDAFVRDGIVKFLTRRGFEVLEAKRAEEAIEQYEKEKESGKVIDVVVLDFVSYSGRNGIEAAKILRKIDSQVKLILNTGTQLSPLQKQEAEQYFNAQIQKPYSIIHLENTIRDVLK